MGLAGVLLARNFNHTANRAFALWLVPTGLSFLARAMQELPQPGPDDPFWVAVGPYFDIAAFVFLLYFASVYPRRRRWVLPGVLGFAPFLGAAAVLSVLYAADHGFMDGPAPILTWALTVAGAPTIGVLSLLLLREGLRSPTSAAGQGALLLSAGFASTATYDVLLAHAVLLQDALEQGTAALMPRAHIVVAAALFTAALAAVTVVVAREARRGGPAQRFARRYLAMLAACVVTAVVAVAVRPETSAPALAFRLLWNLGLPLIGTYALLRHQLFGVEVRVKWAVKQSTIAGVFVGVFFVVSESATTFLSSTGLGPYLGIAAAGALVFALAPLQRAAERVASTAMPGVRSASELSHPERVELYRQQLRAAWADGVLSSDERTLLRVAREQLGISLADADRMEQEVQAGLRPPERRAAEDAEPT